MDLSDATTNIDIGSSKVLTAYVTDGMNYTDCYNITHLCFAIFNGPRASFMDLNILNNIKCFLLSSNKDCEPGKFTLCKLRKERFESSWPIFVLTVIFIF